MLCKVSNKFKKIIKAKRLDLLGGFIQFKEFRSFQKDKESRSFLIELKYASFVLKYAANLKNLYGR
jgi:hypothetical protein